MVLQRLDLVRALDLLIRRANVNVEDLVRVEAREVGVLGAGRGGGRQGGEGGEGQRGMECTTDVNT